MTKPVRPWNSQRTVTPHQIGEERPTMKRHWLAGRGETRGAHLTLGKAKGSLQSVPVSPPEYPNSKVKCSVKTAGGFVSSPTLCGKM